MSVEFVKYQRILTERKNIDEQGTWEGYFTHKLYHLFRSFDCPVIELLDFITIPHGQYYRSCQAGQLERFLVKPEARQTNATNRLRWASKSSGFANT
jgi:hypothetical protein